MAARVDWTGVKTQVTCEQIVWRLDPSPRVRARDSVLPLRLQKWRVVGDGRTTKEQIRDYASRCREFSTLFGNLSRSEEELENNSTVVPTSLPLNEFHPSSSPVPTVEEEAYLEDRGQSSSLTHSVVEAGETMLGQSPPDGGAAPSSGSEFTNADGYISGQEEESESEKEYLEEDSVELTINEAHDFKIFQPDDLEKREPASILDLHFDVDVDIKNPQRQEGTESEVCSARLLLMGHCSSDSSGYFIRTIDSWSMKQDGERKLELYVRDTKNLWIKLRTPFKEYEVSVRDARLIAKFLELAMTAKETDTKKCLNKLKKNWLRDEITTVLLKYYPSVVEKVLQSSQGPEFARMTSIIKNMESLLRGKLKRENLEKGKPVASVKRPSSSDETKSENNMTSGVQSLGNKRRRIEELDSENFPEKQAPKPKTNPASTVPASNKRKRVVESDFEDESGSEDHVPLAQRQFQLSWRSQTNNSLLKDELVENVVRRNEPDTDNESRKHDQDSGAYAGLRSSPDFNENDALLRWDEVGIDDEGEQEYQDIADAYGGPSHGLGEIVDDDDEELGDSAFCAICDDGGDLLFCDGPCMRSFHASKESAARSESKCRSLGYDPEAVREMGSWKCPNCVHGQHQCFICGQLGRSEGDDKEIYICDVALCGRFYHPGCLAKWKKDEKLNSIMDEDAFIRGVKAGVGEFCCPAHKCRRCGEGEEEGGDDNSMKLAKCRRCPRAYHKLCLPKSISFVKEPIRAWEIGDEDDPMKLLVIYCLTHEIIEHLSTPKRNHLKWPKASSSPENIRHKDSLTGMGHLTQPTQKQQKFPKNTTRQISIDEGDDEFMHGSYSKGAKVSSRQKVSNEDLNLGERHAVAKPDSDLDFSAIGGRDRSIARVQKRNALVVAPTPLAPRPKHVNLPRKNDLQKKNLTVSSVAKSFPTSTEGREERVLEIMRRASQKITLETVKENLAQPSCYGENRKKNFLHLGELQSMINAIKKAAEKVKNGGSMEDAKRLCPKDYFLRFLRNEDMLKVHLAPILHGMRYTSFGRHFTCIDKLKEIVNRIHPYIDSGDMIVDFCCGANDFSIILNEKLLSTSKTCQFMNFDIHPPKVSPKGVSRLFSETLHSDMLNDFCFTKGDWLINQGQGFLEGKKLIMGLNPPFGVRAALANRFIIHALKFKPKLLVLIVPPETMSDSADFKSFGYDLVWEDKSLLAGHAFYLPGSVDENDGQNKTQWNVIPPPLYLWSSRDMVQQHRDIAVRYNHVESLTADPLVLHNIRTPTPPAVEDPRPTPPAREVRRPTPPAREVPRLTIPSDKWTNSGSTPTECDTSSSRLKHSSATSSLSDGHSQNSFNGSGTLSAVCYQAAVQNSSLGKPIQGEQAPDQTAHQQGGFMRTGLARSSVGHTPVPGAGPAQNDPLPVLSHPHLIQNPASAALSSHIGPPYSKFHRSGAISATEVIAKHGNPQMDQSPSELILKRRNGILNQSSPIGNQAQWGQGERRSQYHYDSDYSSISRNSMDSVDQQHIGPQSSHRHLVLEPHPPQNLHGAQPWLGFTTCPNIPYNPGFQQLLPNQVLPMWPPIPAPPPPLPYLGPGIGPGLRRSFPSTQDPFPPIQDPYLERLPVPFERRPGSGQHDLYKESGGWLDQ